MARLTSDQWIEMRREWESSPTQGLTWLTKAAGGRWDITEEPIRKRRAAEGWAKPVNMAWVVRHAHAAADTHSAVQTTADPRVKASNEDATTDIGHWPPKRPDPSSDDGGAAAQSTPHPAEGIAVDLRTELLERHRREWGAARRLLYRSIVESEKAT